jgi:hypothetical protein
LDLAVFAPIGLLAELQQEVPRLAEAGRRRVEQRLTVAKFVGQMAVAYGRRELDRRLGPPAPEARETAAEPPIEVAPIPGYDKLAAAEIVQRLNGMDHTELTAVSEYEAANRGRRTVLAKVDQLRGRR